MSETPAWYNQMLAEVYDRASANAGHQGNRILQRQYAAISDSNRDQAQYKVGGFWQRHELDMKRQATNIPRSFYDQLDVNMAELRKPRR